MKKALTLFAVAALFAAGAAYAQSPDSPESISQEQIDAALRDLSALYGSPVVRADQARAICDQEQYMVECAEIGKKHGLFPKEREEEVNALLTELKGQVIEELKRCGSTECLITVATKIAEELNSSNPSLARNVELTPQKVREKRVLVETAREIGVDFDECRGMDPDSASVELLRACARLAKHADIQQYIPEENRGRAEKTENTAALKEALQSGEFSCGDGTLEGCGTFCFALSESGSGQAVSSAPPVCRQIAERFFGEEGVRELENTHQNVRRAYDEVRKTYSDDSRAYVERRGEYDDRNGPYRDQVGIPYSTTTTPGSVCPAVEYSPCPQGQYRQDSLNDLGCFVRSACIPFNTQTQSEPINTRFICPSLPTALSCSTGEEKVVAFTSPECGTYYTCKPKPEERSIVFPYGFKSGRVALSFEEARVYCYESGQGGATERGDKAECLSAFGITVPDIPPEKQCANYGAGWHAMDSSGNCFNPSMTEYRTPGGILQRCVNAPVYGCTASPEPFPQSGQKEQVWNSLGLRSWIRTDASSSRIAELKAACANTPQSANVWLPGAGTFSSADFGMPDPEKCRQASSCSSGQYWNGSSCVTTGDQGGTCPPYQAWYTPPGGGAGYCQPIPGSTTTPTSGSCSSELLGLLGSGCHNMGNAWFNSEMTQYVYPGTTQVKSCTTDYISGCTSGGGTSSCPSGQYWSSSGCVSSTDYSAQQLACSTAGGAWSYSGNYCQYSTVSGSCSSELTALLGSGCHNMGNAWFNGGMTQYVLPGSQTVRGCTTEYLSGCSGGGTQTTSCPSGQYWSGSSCVPSGTAESCSSELLGLLGSGCHNMGNAWFNGGMTQYVYPGTTQVKSCTTDYISGCTSGGGTSSCPSGQYWNGTSCVATSPTDTPSTSCSSGQYWNGSACVTSSYTPPPSSSSTSCSSGQYWDGSACVTSPSTPPPSSSSTSCPSGQYWNGSACAPSETSPASYPDAQSGCTSAGGTWNSADNYCVMPTSSIGSPLAYLCPSGHEWNGSYCTVAERTGVTGFLANVFEAFASLFSSR